MRGRRRDRLSPERHRLSLRDSEGGGEARGLARRTRAPYQIDSRLIGPERDRPAAAGIAAPLAGRALHAERRLRRAGEGHARPSPTRRCATAPRSSSIAPCAASRRRRARVAASSPRKGRSRCSQVVLAGGAWTRPVLRQSRRRLAAAQDAGLGDAHRAGRRRAGALRSAPAISRFASGSTAATPIAQRNAQHRPDRAGQLYAVLAISCPALVKQWHELRLRVGRRFLEEWRMPRRWALDAVTPFETGAHARPRAIDRRARGGRRNLVREPSRPSAA